jgi:hypothetical protein
MYIHARQGRLSNFKMEAFHEGDTAALESGRLPRLSTCRVPVEFVMIC